MLTPNYAATYGNDTSRPAGYVRYRCDHDGLHFDGYNPPAMCECGAGVDKVWMITRCGDCGGALYLPRGRMLTEKCGGNGKGHQPQPASINEPPTSDR